MFYVYILQSKKNKKLYIGRSNDWKTRLKKHNRGEVKATKPYIPYEIIYYCAFVNEKDTTACEKYFKTTAGWRRTKRMLTNTLKK